MYSVHLSRSLFGLWESRIPNPKPIVWLWESRIPNPKPSLALGIEDPEPEVVSDAHLNWLCTRNTLIT